MLWRLAKTDVAQCNSISERHFERSNRSIEILVIDSVLVVPNTRRRIRYFIRNERNTVVYRIRPDLDGRRSGPGSNGSFGSLSRSDRSKAERACCAGNTISTVRDV